MALRATYSEAFRAPGPTESGESSSLSFTNIAIITIGDPGVKPETAKSYTVGFIVEPTSDTNVTLDYFRVDRKNEITAADQAAILGGAPLSVAPGEPFRAPGALPNSFLYYDELGDLVTISGPYSNLTQTMTDGLDFDSRQRFELGGAGSLDIALLWTHVFNLERTDADGLEIEYAGTHGPYALGSAGGTPRNRGWLEITWSRDAVALTARANYVSSMKMIDHLGEQLVDGEDGTYHTTTGEGSYFNVDPNGILCGVYNPNGSVRNACEVDAFTTVDLYGVYRGGEKWHINLSITNVLDKVAPFDPYTYEEERRTGDFFRCSITMNGNRRSVVAARLSGVHTADELCFYGSGASVFSVTLRSASSTARTRVSIMAPPFAAPYAPLPMPTTHSLEGRVARYNLTGSVFVASAMAVSSTTRM